MWDWNLNSHLHFSLLFLDRPPAPVNVSVINLKADSATVSWEVPEGDIIIGFSVLQQVKTLFYVHKAPTHFVQIV